MMDRSLTSARRASSDRLAGMFSSNLPNSYIFVDTKIRPPVINTGVYYTMSLSSAQSIRQGLTSHVNLCILCHMYMNSVDVIRLIIRKKRGGTELACYRQGSRLASESIQVAAVKQTYGHSQPTVMAQSRPTCQACHMTGREPMTQTITNYTTYDLAYYLRRPAADSSPLGGATPPPAC